MSLKSFDLNHPDYNNNLVKNIISWIDDGFYQDGGYFTTSGNLSKVDHPEYVTGQVWGSNRKNWSWRDPVTVRVNNVVNTLNSIDYINGLVIFSGVITGTVNVQYSYKHIYIVDGKDIDFKASYGKFDVYDGTYRENALQLPAIVVDLGSSSSKPLELGGYSRTVSKNVLLNIFHRDNGLVERISDILFNQVESSIPLFNFDTAYASGSYPLDFNGFLLNVSGTHSNLSQNYPYTQAATHSADIYSSENEGSKKIANNLYHNTIRWEVKSDLKMGIS